MAHGPFVRDQNQTQTPRADAIKRCAARLPEAPTHVQLRFKGSPARILYVLLAGYAGRYDQYAKHELRYRCAREAEGCEAFRDHQARIREHSRTHAPESFH